jgi:biotin-[acetyl-CoA-carboxylase] ligase BirA-like protein
MNIKYFNYYAIVSTNEVALEKLVAVNDTNTAIVVKSKIQKHGRGRNNKVWLSDNGNLYYTFGFKHSLEKLPIYMPQVIGGLAVYMLLSEIIGEKFIRLKYPNDIYVLTKDAVTYKKKKKIAGVISEHIFLQTDICSSVIGIGINNEQKEFPEELNATSLLNMGKTIDNDYLKERITEIIVSLIKADKDNVLKLWKKKLKLENKKIKIIDNTTQQEVEDEFMLDNILGDCRLSVINTKGNIRIIDNGDSIRYDF